jgi:hypothetical protein
MWEYLYPTPRVHSFFDVLASIWLQIWRQQRFQDSIQWHHSLQGDVHGDQSGVLCLQSPNF